MTVSRTGKRGKPKMRRATRMRRVGVNAAFKAITRPVQLGVTERQAWTFHASGIDDWARDERPANGNDNVAPLALNHGRYEVVDTIVRPGVLETALSPLMVNRAVTVTDDWIDADVFYGYQIRVIERARDLWRAVRHPRHPHFDRYDPEDRDDSFEAERAKALLHRARRLVGDYHWNIFENVIRWNEPTGIPGSRMARISDASIVAAQSVVRDVATEIGKARVF